MATASNATATGTVTDSALFYQGFSYRETGGAVATILIADGEGGTVLEAIRLAANEAARAFYAPGVAVTDSIHVTITGTVVGSVRHA